MAKDYCTWFPEKWIKVTWLKLKIEIVDISPCCKGHDTTCSTREFFLCLKGKINEIFAAPIGFVASIGCWLKEPKKMITKYKDTK